MRARVEKRSVLGWNKSSAILFRGVFDPMIFLVNTDYMFTLDYVDIEDIYFFPLLEGVVKENIKLFDQS